MVDPIDHARTARRHAGQPVDHGANAPGLIVGTVAVAAMTIGLFALADGNAVVGTVALVLAAVSGMTSAIWLLRTHGEVRETQRRRHAAHSDEPPPPPTG